MKKIRYALVGFGRIAQNRIVREGFNCGNEEKNGFHEAELIGVADFNAGRSEIAKSLGLKWFDHFQAILEDKNIDAIFIATNNLTHFELAKAALNSGKHVLVEKPMASTLSNAEELCRIARSRKLSLGIDHMMIHNAYNAEAKKLLAKGALGDVSDACFHMESLYGATPEEAATWRCSNVKELGGPIGDIGSHCLYMTEYILGSPIAELACTYYPKLMSFKVEDGAYFRLHLESGIKCSIRVSFCDHRGGELSGLSGAGYEIYGDKAILRGYGTLSQLSGFSTEKFPLRLELDEFKKQTHIKVPGIKNIYQEVIRTHARSIATGNLMDGTDGLHNLKLITAAHNSAQNQGRVITINNQEM